MNLFSDQISAVGARQFDAQLQLFRSAAGSALDGAEQFAALQFATTRGALETSTELLREVAAARDPRDLFALTKHTRAQFDSVLAYQTRLFGIVSAISGSVAGLQRTVTPTTSAALQKLAALPPVSPVAAATAVADHFIEQSVQAVEHTEQAIDAFAGETIEMAGQASDAVAAAVTPDEPEVVDDIIEQTNDVVEQLKAEDEAAASVDAPTAEAAIEAAAEPIAELTAVAAATGHQEPRPSAAPVDAPPAEPAVVGTAKSGGKGRKK